MKVIFKTENGNIERNLLDTFENIFLSVICEKVEIPELTNYYRKRFNEEDKQKEFESFTNH